MRLVPRAVVVVVKPLLFRRQPGKDPFGTVLHHMVETVGNAVRQPPHKGVLLRQHGQQTGGILVFRDGLSHLHGELIGKSHDRQKFLLSGGEGVDHGGGEHGVDI